MKRSGMGFCSVLTLILVVLKLTGNITCSWIWVLSPMWIPIAILLLALMFFFL